LLTNTPVFAIQQARDGQSPDAGMAAYLQSCPEEADRDAGLSRESLSKALSGERSPDIDTILKVIGAPGLKLHAETSHS
jgi:hypothetical protein